VYCVSGTDEDDIKDDSKDGEIISVDEILKQIKLLNEILDLEVIRLTGGEPTLYKDLLPLIAGVRELGMKEIKMTSNAFLLKNKAKALAEAGLTHLNISLDAIDPDVFFNISRRKNIKKVIEGIDEAINSGIEVKLNSVIMKGTNDSQIIPLLEFAFDRKIVVRFLELMKMGHLQNGNFSSSFYSEEEILAVIDLKYKSLKLKRKKASTANYWETDEGQVFGVIANESEPFCNDCNRLRMDSFGNIYGCLSENKPISILESNSALELSKKLLEALNHKQKVRFKGSEISMLAIGG